ncbi:MAG: DUF2249 domain-containing protein [bacterium]
MKITPQTKIIDIIKQHPELIDILASYNSHFELLKNPIMRKTFAKLATVRHASKVAGVNLTELVKLLNNAIGESISDEEISEEGGTEVQPEMPVKSIVEQHHVKITNLDVRDIMRKGEEPFNIIMQTVKKIKEGEALVLETIFEPAPLYEVMKKKGFQYQTEILSDEHYKIWFYKLKVNEPGKESEVVDLRNRIKEEGDTVYVDVRGLEPPQPMALILETLAKLDPSKTLVVQHERVPMFLYPKLDEKGYIYETHEIDQHNVQLIIKSRQ